MTTEPIKLGSPLRDAAVDPQPGDHLAPANAGAEGQLGNPHGPSVVNPGLPREQGPHPTGAPWPASSPDPREIETNQIGTPTRDALNQSGANR